MHEDAPADPPPIYVRRTRENVWHWCWNCPQHPRSMFNNNGLIMTMIKPANRDLCPECIALTRAKERAP